MSYSMRYVVIPSPVTDETLFDRLKGASPSRGNLQSSSGNNNNNNNNNSNNNTVIQTTFDAIKSVPVSQISVGPAHVVLLLEDGRVCRAPYQVLADRLDYPTAYPCQPTSQLISTSTLGPAHLVNTSSSNTGSNVASNHPSNPNQPHQHHSHYQHHQHQQQQQQNQQQSSHNSSSSFPLLNSPKSSLSNVNLSNNNNSNSNTNNPNQIGVNVIAPGALPTLDGRINTSVPSSNNTIPSSSTSSSSQNAPSPNVPSFASRVNIAPQGVGSLSIQHRQVARRGRMLRQTGTRGRATSVIMGSRAGLIAPQYVPEDLINQAQVVLQGKPRSVIVRELQRTNLDVNSAVNNLLSSDNEDPEDMDESQDYLPNEDLISLLDSNVNLPGAPTSVLIDAETVFPEDVFNSYSAPRIRPTTIRHSVGSGRNQSERESSLASELEMRRAVNRDQSRRWLEHALRDSPMQDSQNSSGGRGSQAGPTDFTLHNQKNQDGNSQNSSSSGCARKTPAVATEPNPIQMSDSVEIWPTSQDRKFVQIASLYSELIAISNTGQIHQWRWCDPTPFEGIRCGDTINYHSKVSQLNLTHEKVQFLAASCIRATVVTESSKVATWIDDSIGLVGNRLEHSAQNFSEFQKGGKIVQLHVCSLYSCVRLESGALYWWGVAPFSQRKKNWKKIQSKSNKSVSGAPNSAASSGSSSSSSEITVGSVVCLKNGPSFGDGAIGFTTKDGIPKVGRLVMSAWNIDDTCTFKVIKPSERKPQFITTSQPTTPTSAAAPPISTTTTTTQSHQLDTKVNITSSATTTRARKMLGQPIDFSGNQSSSTADDQQQQQLPPSSPGMSKNSSSERLEMPPPPSPASSTCSEPGCSPSHKRKIKHLIAGKDGDADKYRDEEQWNLKDVTFLEEVKKPPVAKVIKLDGNTALVRFNQRDPFGQQADSDVNAYLQDCRMIRKEELQLARDSTSSCRIIDCQRSPKKLTISESINFLTFTVSNNGIHALVSNNSTGKVEYKIYQLASGRVSKSLVFPTDTQALLGRDHSLITLYACGESDVTVTLRDGNGSLYPLAKDHLDAIKEPQPLDMAPIQALGMAIHPLKDPQNPSRIVPTLVMALALENQILIPAVLRSDPEYVRLTLASLDKEPVSQQIVASEKIDLNRNILHVAVYACAPATGSRGCQDKSCKDEPLYQSAGSSTVRDFLSNKPGSSESSVKRTRGPPAATKRGPSGARQQQHHQQDLSATHDLVQQQQDSIQSMSSSCDATTSSSSSCAQDDFLLFNSIDTSILDWSNPIFARLDIDSSEQKLTAHLVLMILIENPILKPFLKDLMLQRDAHGMTPFMSAVSHRAYTAAIMLLELAHKIVTLESQETVDSAYRQKLFSAMIFPPNSHLDNNPLFMLCANDTCSFTWTGANHINQDIFECRTCGLTRTLCCCTECARTCHKGHDCRLKKTSPTAYCDCWEKCKCKSLVAGSQQMRFRLLERLLVETDLVTYPDSKGEMILLFLVQTVGRQMMEQRQYGPDRSPRHTSKRDDPPGMPDHDLSPPRFARKALHKMLSEWTALKSVIMAGTSASQNLANVQRNNSLLSNEDQVFLSNQQGTAILDRFTHSVLIKIGPEMLDVLLTTIIVGSSSVIPSIASEALLVAKRFVRSVARNGVVLSIELSPNNYSRPSSVTDWSSALFNHQNSSTHGYGPNSWKPSPPVGSVLQRCRKVFQALLPIAAEELAEIADAIISPVRLGVPRPTASFSLVNSMAEATQGSEEIFVVEPVVLPTTSANQQQQQQEQQAAANQQQQQHQQMLLAPPTLQPAIGSNANSNSSSSASLNLASSAGLLDNNSTSHDSRPEPPILSSNNPSPSVHQSGGNSSSGNANPAVAIIYDNEIAMDAIDSEASADASNSNTFRPSNNGESDSESDSNADDSSFQSANIGGSSLVVRSGSSARGGGGGGVAGNVSDNSHHEVVAYFSEPDSDGSSENPEEDDEESEANDTEQDTDDLALANEDSYPFSRRSGGSSHQANSSADNHHHVHHHHHHHHHGGQSSSSSHSAGTPGHGSSSLTAAARTATAAAAAAAAAAAGNSSTAISLGHQLHWALRHRDHSFYPSASPHSSAAAAAAIASSPFPGSASRLASMGLANAYNYLEGPPTSARRSVMSGGPTGGPAGLNAPASGPNNSELSTSATSIGLARAFSIIIRSISDLIPILRDAERSSSALTINQLRVSPIEAAVIISKLEAKMQPVWEWLFRVMDSTEGQLRFGCALTNGIQAANSAATSTTTSSAAHHSSASGGAPHHHYMSAADHSSSRNHGGTTTGSSGSYFSASNTGSQAPGVPLTLNSASLSRMNSNLAAHNLQRGRMPSILDEAASSRAVQSRISFNDPMSLQSDTAAAASAAVAHSMRLQNAIGSPGAHYQPPPQHHSHHHHQQQPPPVLVVGPGGRPQSLARANFASGLRLADQPEGSENFARRDFLSYMISLIKGHGNEHHDSLPILDVSSLRHVAYVFDAYVYFLQFLNSTSETSKLCEGGQQAQDIDQDSGPLTASSEQSREGGSNQAFFRRSESTLFLNDFIPDPFSTPINEALPLAVQPHLLQPHVRREELFGMTQRTELNINSLPLHLGLSSSNMKLACPKCNLIKQQASSTTTTMTSGNPAATNQAAMDQVSHWPHCPNQHQNPGTLDTNSSPTRYNPLLGRWRLTVELFGREFLDDVGAEPGSILIDLVGFPHKENRFRREMERLRNDTMAREISLTNVDRDHSTLIRQTIKELNYSFHMIDRMQNRRNHELPILACSKVKVSFKDEKGEGNGVARSFYTAFCEAVLANEKLANLDMPLFYQPGIRNFYSPMQGDAQPERLNAFRNVGRIIGICLSQSEICPIQLNRHVIKYLLRRPIGWHDLAFFDPVLYESLRQLIVDAEQSQKNNTQSTLSTLDLRFCVDLCPEEGGGQCELAPGGADIEVTAENVYEYVRRYALKRMIKSQEKALQAMRQGIMDVLPASVMENLTAEDFRLLLNGVGEINVQTLINYTTFIDDRATSAAKRNSVHLDDQLGYFKKWFWSIVEKMSIKERQDLVYFWTGTPAIPASDEGFQPMPTVSIRPAEDLHLPTSNVCIFRLYIPLYSSKTILRNKLLIAIKERNFGFI